MATGANAQPQDADFYGIETKQTFEDSVVWIGIGDLVSVDISNKTVAWVVHFYNSSFEEVISRPADMDFPSQALPLKNLKSKMKDESAVVLDLVYNGQEQ